MSEAIFKPQTQVNMIDDERGIDVLFEDGGAVIIDNDTKRLERYRFSGMNWIRKISLFACTDIGDGAFQQCRNLEELSIPSATYIGSAGTYQDTSLKKLKFYNIKSFPYSILGGANMMEELELVDCNITSGAFNGSPIKKLVITGEDCTIYSGSLTGCIKLEEIRFLTKNKTNLTGNLVNTIVQGSRLYYGSGRIIVPSNLYDSYYNDRNLFEVRDLIEIYEGD